MNRLLAALAVALAALTAACNGYPSDRPLEDEPGWNCQVNGNGHCGPTTYTGTVRLVAASHDVGCDFDEYDDEQADCE